MPPPDPAKTASFLLGLRGVVDVSLWTKKDTLLGRVVVTSDSGWTGKDLQILCEARLGPGQAPALLLLASIDASAAAA